MIGNYVGERLEIIRAHQADVRVDWSASNNDKIFGRFSFAEYEQRIDKRAFPLLLGSSQDAPFRNLAFNWNRIFTPSLVNEVLVGYNQVAIVNHTTDWNGIGNANATFGIAGGQPIAGLSSIGWGGGLTSAGGGASDSDTLDRTFQINEKLIWLRGRHSMKFGGQLLHYVQRRFYAGNNGLLGLFGYGGAFTGFPFSDFLLDQVLSKGRGSQAERVDTPAQSHGAVRPGRLQSHAGVDAESRDSVGVHRADRRKGQSSIELRPEHRAADSSGRRRVARVARSTTHTRRASSRASDSRTIPPIGGCVRGGYGITQYMEGTGANLRLPLNPPFFFESAVQYDATTGAGTLATGFAELRPLDQPSGQVRAWDPNLRPQLTQQWNVFAEYLLAPSMSANVGYVGHNAKHLVAPVEGNQPRPGVGDPSTWAPLDTRRPLYATAPLITNISTTASRGRSDYHALQASLRQRNINGLEYLASYTLGRVRTNNRGFYGSLNVAAEGAYWMNAYEPEWNYGPAFFDARHNLVFSANYELPFGQGRKWGGDASASDQRHSWRLEIQRDLAGANRVSPSQSSMAAVPRFKAVRGNERPNCVGDPGAVRPEHQPLARLQCVRTRCPRHLGQLSDWRRARTRLQESRRRSSQSGSMWVARVTSSSEPRRST